MNLRNEKIRALMTSIEHLKLMKNQPQYQDIQHLLNARIKVFENELNYILKEEYYED